MLKKIVLISLFIGMTGILVVGAVGRTLDMTEHTAEARGYFNGNDHTDVGKYAEGESGANDEADEYETSGLGQGRSGYSSQSEMGSIAAERKYPNYDGAPPEELLLREGTVVLAPEDGVDLVIEMSDGKKLSVGTGHMYMASQGFILQAGEPVQVLGYWEDHEFQAVQLTCLADGRTIILRDALGRPAWAGAGRRAGGGQNL